MVLSFGELSFLAIQYGQTMPHQRATQIGIDAAEDALSDRNGNDPEMVVEQLHPLGTRAGAVAALLAPQTLEKQQ